MSTTSSRPSACPTHIARSRSSASSLHVRPQFEVQQRSGRAERPRAVLDASARAYLMGGPDTGVRHDVMGESDGSFVDWLFGP